MIDIRIVFIPGRKRKLLSLRSPAWRSHIHSHTRKVDAPGCTRGSVGFSFLDPVAATAHLCYLPYPQPHILSIKCWIKWVKTHRGALHLGEYRQRSSWSQQWPCRHLLPTSLCTSAAAQAPFPGSATTRSCHLSPTAGSTDFMDVNNISNNSIDKNHHFPRTPKSSFPFPHPPGIFEQSSSPDMLIVRFLLFRNS